MGCDVLEYIVEPAKQIKVCADVDVCVIGGSCTGVFAAIRAARLGAKVAIVEKQNCFGGVATNGLVNIWHSLYDIGNKNQIIAGLTEEMIERLKTVDGVYVDLKSPTHAYYLNTEELKIELDNVIKENRIIPFLHTFYSFVITDDKKITSVLIENKDGRSAIRAKFFIDATGDGDVARDLHINSYQHDQVQPPSACFYLQGKIKNSDLADMILHHGSEVGLDDDWGWSGPLVNSELTLRVDNHVFNVLCNNAMDLTLSEMEGRRQMRALVTLLKKYGYPSEKYNLISSCSHIGIRETIHYETNFKANEMDLLCGTKYEDAVLNGTYRVDIHHGDQNGITFKDLTGKMVTYYGKRNKKIVGNWREDLSLTGDYATYYQFPFANIVGKEYENFIAVGRMIHADASSFGALRVMVNLNQLGEAAGVAAYLAIDGDVAMQKLQGKHVRNMLRKGGSAL
ncbi:MAG TPA: FAD-dependent oxidoreductase [Clostridiales bacterium]|nr:FAD-dependent oxidoreductase [Clostridiales bacterium]